MDKYTDCEDCTHYGSSMCYRCVHGKLDCFELEYKLINLSAAQSNIDMEFLNYGGTVQANAKLKDIHPARSDKYQDDFGNHWFGCRIRQNHWHSWNNENNEGKCPLPEGLKIKLKFINTSFDLSNKLENKISYKTTTHYLKENWDHSTLVAFKILRLAKGWKYKSK